MFKSGLLNKISLLSLIAVMMLPVYTVFFIHPSFNKLISNISEEEAARLATSLALLLIKENTVLQKNTLTPDFPDSVNNITKKINLMKIKVFSPAGEVVYSTDPADIGQINRSDYFTKIMSGGKTYTKIVQKDSRSLEGQTVTADVVETYVPVIRGERFIGAFEIYYDITALKTKYNKLVYQAAAVLFPLTYGLMTALVMSLIKANKLISERQQAKEAFEKTLNNSEIIVEERTAELSTVNEKLRDKISELKQTESRLAYSEGYLRSIINSEPESLKILNRDGTLMEINPAGLIITEADSSEQIVGKSIYHLIQPSQQDAFRAFNEGVCDGNSGTFEFEIIGLKGTRRWLSTHAVPFKQDDRSLSLFITRDITEYKKTLEDYMELTELYAGALNDIKQREIHLIKSKDAFFNMLEDINEAYKELETLFISLSSVR